MGSVAAQIHPRISTVGAQFVDSGLKTLKAALEAIRGTATKALSQIEQSQEGRAMAMEMQRVPVCEAFYQACSVGNHRQMSQMKNTEFRPIL